MIIYHYRLESTAATLKHLVLVAAIKDLATPLLHVMHQLHLIWLSGKIHYSTMDEFKKQVMATSPHQTLNFQSLTPRLAVTYCRHRRAFPVTSNNEMRGENFHKDDSPQAYREKLAARLGGYGSQAGELTAEETQYWLNEFRQAFNAPDGLPNVLITAQNISAALADYQRSQVFTNNKWKNYIEGNTEAISNNAKQGALLFYRQQDQNGYACVNCHSGDFFTNEQFHHMLIPPVGPGKVDKNGLLLSNRDTGRGLITGNSMDRFKFRVPSLLNVEVTGPWAHNGAYTTLAGITRHMLNPYESIVKYDPRQLLQSSVQTAEMRKHMGEMLACDVAILEEPTKKKRCRNWLLFYSH